MLYTVYNKMIYINDITYNLYIIYYLFNRYAHSAVPFGGLDDWRLGGNEGLESHSGTISQFYRVTVSRCLNGAISQCHSVTTPKCRNVTVSQCHIVTTSQYHNASMSLCHNVSTSQCHGVAMPQYRSVATSQRLSVAMSRYHSGTMP